MPYLILAIVIIVFILVSYFNKKIKVPVDENDEKNSACDSCKISGCWIHDLDKKIKETPDDCPNQEKKGDNS